MRAENSPVPVLLTPRAPLGACQLQGRLRSSSNLVVMSPGQRDLNAGANTGVSGLGDAGDRRHRHQPCHQPRCPQEPRGLSAVQQPRRSNHSKSLSHGVGS